ALTPVITRLVVNSVSCTPPFVQEAGVAALTGTQEPVNQLRSQLRVKRDRFVSGLNSIGDGVTCASPEGAFYACLDVADAMARKDLTTEAFASRLLTEQGVAALAGTGFGEAGRDHIRLSFAVESPVLDRAVERIREFVCGG